MDLKVFSRDELVVVLRALRAVAVANDRFTKAEREFVEAVASIHGADIDADFLDPISVEEVARHVTQPHGRKRAVQLAIAMALVEGQPSDNTEQAVRALASALHIAEPGLQVLYEMSHGHFMLARFAMARRLRVFAESLEAFPGFFKVMLPALGIAGENPELAARYRALSACPAGSFGSALHAHFKDNGFAFPGEKYGLPEAVILHDVGHVLSGYSVEPEGEIQQAAFQAGFRRTDGFTFLLFGIIQFHLGLRLTPVARAQRGLFDVKRVLRAAERGAACRIDLEKFDHFAHAHIPLDEVRAELGIPALA
jgi:hypothetical protein